MTDKRRDIQVADGPEIERLWNEGFGPNTIALKMGFRYSQVRIWLLARGMVRTQTEAKKLADKRRKNSGWDR